MTACIDTSDDWGDTYDNGLVRHTITAISDACDDCLQWPTSYIMMPGVAYTQNVENIYQRSLRSK